MDLYIDRIRELEVELENTRFSAETWRRLYVDRLEERDELKDKLDKARQENAKLKDELKHLKALVREHLKALVRETSW